MDQDAFLDAGDDYLPVLQQEYLADAPTRLAELRKDLAALRAGEADANGSLRLRFHRLAGSGGSYGFPAVTDISRAIELWIKDHPGLGEEIASRVEQSIRHLAEEFDRAARSSGGPVSPIAWPQGFGWTALVVGTSSATCHRVREILAAAEYTVRHAELVPAAADIVFSARPDLVVLVPGEGEVGNDLAEAWGSAGHEKCRAVLLVDPDGTAARIEAAANGVDRIVLRDRLEQILPGFARWLARMAALPLRVLFVSLDDGRATKLTALLEKHGIKASRSRTTHEALAALDSDHPDLVLLDQVPKAEALPFARVLRGGGDGASHGRLGLLPTLWLVADPTAEHLPALAAGIDDLAPADDFDTLAAVIRLRVERGRSARALAHRDNLTGLLSAVSLHTELEYSIAYADRNKEPLSIILLDLDHMTRINDRYGFAIGDQVLHHVGRVLRETVRQSDTVGRLGGEEFALVLRRCDAIGAAHTANKLRDALLGRPATATGVGKIAVRTSGGVAVFPEHGEDAAALLHAAGQAVALAKATGRNRVEMARSKD